MKGASRCGLGPAVRTARAYSYVELGGVAVRVPAPRVVLSRVLPSHARVSTSTREPWV